MPESWLYWRFLGRVANVCSNKTANVRWDSADKKPCSKDSLVRSDSKAELQFT